MNQTIRDYKAILKSVGIKGVKVSEDLGMLSSSYHSATRSNHPNPPMWIKVFVYAFRLGQMSKNK